MGQANAQVGTRNFLKAGAALSVSGVAVVRTGDADTLHVADTTGNRVLVFADIASSANGPTRDHRAGRLVDWSGQHCSVLSHADGKRRRQSLATLEISDLHSSSPLQNRWLSLANCTGRRNWASTEPPCSTPPHGCAGACGWLCTESENAMNRAANFLLCRALVSRAAVEKAGLTVSNPGGFDGDKSPLPAPTELDACSGRVVHGANF